jgi:20S proteasome subunit alpha 6
VAGILLIDSDGIKLVEWDPTGMAREAYGVTIGHRAQSCRTILEDSCEELPDASIEELIKIGIKSLANAHPDPDEGTLKVEDVYIYVIEAGKGCSTMDATQYMY